MNKSRSVRAPGPNRSRQSWFWTEHRIFPAAGEVSPDTHVIRDRKAVYLVLCAVLGNRLGAPQAGLCSVQMICSLLKLTSNRCIQHLRALAHHPTEVQNPPGKGLAGRWIELSDTSPSDTSPFAFRLLAADGTSDRSPADGYFTIDRRVLEQKDKLSPSSLVTYAWICHHDNINFPGPKNWTAVDQWLRFGTNSGAHRGMERRNFRDVLQDLQDRHLVEIAGAVPDVNLPPAGLLEECRQYRLLEPSGTEWLGGSEVGLDPD